MLTAIKNNHILKNRMLCSREITAEEPYKLIKNLAGPATTSIFVASGH